MSRLSWNEEICTPQDAGIGLVMDLLEISLGIFYFNIIMNISSTHLI